VLGASDRLEIPPEVDLDLVGTTGRVVAVEGPAERVFEDGLADVIERAFIPDDVLIVISLPEGLPGPPE
jgi:hypothetical protein